MEFEGRVAIVTGGGSQRGIGRTTVLALARQGATIVVADLMFSEPEALRETVENLGGKLIVAECNVTIEAQVNDVVQETYRSLGRIDILVNNAGITQPIDVLNIKESDWDRILNVNLKGTFLFTQKVLPVMIQARYGRIISLSSVSGKNGGGVYGGAHYCASKAGILGFSKAVAREVGPYGITVNSVAPGLVATDIRGGLESAEEQVEMSKTIPARRLCLPEEVADAIVFLASEKAGYITGEEIDINGGLHMD